jgi:hypothetical protein
MKKLLLTIVLTLTAQVYAKDVLEFDETQEVKCHKEQKALGCVTAADEEDTACVNQKVAKLSTACQKMHKAKQANQ